MEAVGAASGGAARAHAVAVAGLMKDQLQLEGQQALKLLEGAGEAQSRANVDSSKGSLVDTHA